MRGRTIPATLFLLVLAAAEWRAIVTLAIVLLAVAVGLRVVLGRAVGRPAGWLARRLERRPVVVIEHRYQQDQRGSRSR